MKKYLIILVLIVFAVSILFMGISCTGQEVSEETTVVETTSEVEPMSVVFVNACSEGNLEEILEAVDKEKIDVVILGKPIKMAGGTCPVSDDFLEFAEILKKNLEIPVKMNDERLSSKAADALPGGKKTKASRDAIAAMLILQDYLDRKHMK